MKKINWSFLALSLLLSGLSSFGLEANDKVIFMIDQEDEEWIEFFENEGLDPFLPSGEIDDKLVQIYEEELDARPPLSDRHQRIHKMIERRQGQFIRKLDSFMEANFNPEDPGASFQFVNLVNELTKMVFGAETIALYYERLYLINQRWLDNKQEYDRFRLLDRAMTNENLRIEERRKLIREILIGGSSFLGAAGLGYYSFRASQKMLPIVSSEASWTLVLKWLGRGGVILVGAGVGATLGAYVGFLGSDLLTRRSRDYLRPVGNGDLVDLLDEIELLSGGHSWY